MKIAVENGIGNGATAYIKKLGIAFGGRADGLNRNITLMFLYIQRWPAFFDNRKTGQRSCRINIGQTVRVVGQIQSGDGRC